MAQSELKRGTIRVLANYSRLSAFVVFGLLFVPIFISGIGEEAFGILGLLGASVGIAEMCRAIVAQSMIRELGTAYHDDDPAAFPLAYNSAIVLTTAASGLVAMLFGGMYLLLPVLNIPPHLLTATAWLVLAKGGMSVLAVLTAPQFNMYLVTERMMLTNVWRTINRGTDVVIAAILFLLLGIDDPATGLMWFGFLSAGANAVVHLFAVGLIIKFEPRLIPKLSLVNCDSIRSLIGTAGWNTVVVTALNLHIRLDQFIMNIAFGAIGNAIFTLGVRLTGYIWQLAGAAADGLGAVSARLSSKEENRHGIAQMLYHTSRLQAVVTIPATLAVIVLAEPLMVLWVGQATDDPSVIPKAIIVAQVLAFGMLAKGLSQVWMRILYGSGYIRAYAPLVLCGGALNPVTAVLLIFLLPPSVDYLGPAIAFASMFVIFHFLLFPAVVARCMKISFAEVMRPLLRPSIATLFSAPALFLTDHLELAMIGLHMLVIFNRGAMVAEFMFGMPYAIIALLASLALFGGIFAVFCWWYVLEARDRKRLRDGARRRIYRSPERTAPKHLASMDQSADSFEVDDEPNSGNELAEADTDRKSGESKHL